MAVALSINENEKKLTGEVAGSFLLGLIESFSNLYVIASQGLNLELPEIDPQKWYPHSFLIDTLSGIEKTVPSYKELFFRAGVNFLRIWYEQGPGKTMIHSTMDWLYANQESGGYNSVVRGGTREEIGWCRIQSIDEEAGIVVYENVMPLPPDYVRGVFYGGCLIFDDVDYVDVTETHETYDPARSFYRTMITVRFRLKPVQGADDLDAVIESITPDDSSRLALVEKESLAWRYKNLLCRNRYDEDYYKAISTILAQAVKTIQVQHEEILLLSNTDALTGVPNLRIAKDRLKMEHARARRGGGKFAVLFIDLDGFKKINDDFGHNAGDYVLKAAAVRVSSCLRDTDTLARIGGDEFLILLPDTDVPSKALIVAGKVNIALGKPIYFQEQLLQIGSSIGIAMFPDHGDTPEEVIANADKAMYAVKKQGKNNCTVFSPDLAQ